MTKKTRPTSDPQAEGHPSLELPSWPLAALPVPPSSSEVGGLSLKARQTFPEAGLDLSPGKAAGSLRAKTVDLRPPVFCAWWVCLP